MNYCLNCDAEIQIPISWNQLFFPNQKRTLCIKCEEKLERIKGETCQICGREYAEGVCYDCVRWEREEEWKGLLKKNRSLYLYNEEMKELMARWKYRGDYILIEIFREKVQEVYEHFQEIIDVIVPIPLSRERLFERGFNQSLEIAKLFSLPIEEVLYRTHSEKQSKKTRQERIESDNVFKCKEGVCLEGKTILIIDDIYTTGTTLRHGAKLLKESGAKEIYSFTLIR